MPGFSAIFFLCYTSKIFTNEISPNEQEILNSLYEQDPQAFVKSGKLIYFGSECNKKYHIYTYEFVSGQSKRSTKRLPVLNRKYKYLGQYLHFNDFPEKIINNAVLFPYEPEDGNSIVFHKCTIPKKIYLDGEVVFFYK